MSSGVITTKELLLFKSTVKGCSLYDLNEYSDASLLRRIERITINRKISFTGLLKNIREKSGFLEQIINDITVNTTELFRDPPVWQYIYQSLLPLYSHCNTIHIWHAGCSTGPEVYSMLMVLSELNLLDKAKIIASDINNEALAIARQGVYNYKFNKQYVENFNDVFNGSGSQKPIMYEKYMDIDEKKDTITIKNFLREIPEFKQNDLVKTQRVSYSRFDIILCRNVVIYFNNELQSRVFGFMYDNLFTNGSLVLGTHENLPVELLGKFEKNKYGYMKKNNANFTHYE